MSASWSHLCADASATQALAQQLVATLPQKSILGLRGTLGAGKTTFVQGLARGLGAREDADADAQVVSPTYAWVHEYALPGGLLIHLDLYRLEDVQQAEVLGLLEQIYRPDARLVAVEWPERLADNMPHSTLWVDMLATQTGARRCTFTGIVPPTELAP